MFAVIYGALASRRWEQAVFPVTALVCAVFLAAVYYRHRNEP